MSKYSIERSAPDLFQERMNAILSCLDGVEVAMDDVLIHAPYQELLEIRSTNTLEALHLAGLKLNKEKLVFGTT